MRRGVATPGATSKQSENGCLVIAAVVGVLVVLGRCAGSAPTTPAAQAVDAAKETLATAVAEQTPRPIDELSPSSVRLGSKRVSLASVEGLPGEMIYSQNCYDVLGRTFNWHKLDECGGFDIRASVSMADEVADGEDAAAAWFDGEAAAGRYLKAATAAGLAADAADERLAALQRRVGPAQKAKPTPADNIVEPTLNASEDAESASENVAAVVE